MRLKKLILQIFFFSGLDWESGLFNLRRQTTDSRYWPSYACFANAISWTQTFLHPYSQFRSDILIWTSAHLHQALYISQCPSLAFPHLYSAVSFSDQPENSVRASKVYSTVPPLYQEAAPSTESKEALISPPGKSQITNHKSEKRKLCWFSCILGWLTSRALSNRHCCGRFREELSYTS